MENMNDFTEPEHRHCPICDAEIRIGSPLHQCTKKKLKELEKRSRLLEEAEEDLEERCYDDKLQEYEEHFDNDSYYDKEEEEE